MPKKMIWRQIVLAFYIFLLICIIQQVETPWSQKVLSYVEYALSDEFSWDSEDVEKLGIKQLNLGVRANVWKEQASNSLKEKLGQFSTMVNEKIREIIAGWQG
ncbi:MAG: hypothetical protein KAX49_16175 [Halanaerobiales bacterium]|nr:hypothetical protein [Halanaerobiales bacterium]